MFFKTRKENLKLRLQVIELTKRVDRLMGECGSEKDKNRENQTIIRGLTQDLSKVNKKLREQTEADLLINALKALKIIPDKREAPDYFGAASALQRQLGAAAQQTRPSLGPVGLSQFGGGLGLSQFSRGPLD